MTDYKKVNTLLFDTSCSLIQATAPHKYQLNKMMKTLALIFALMAIVLSSVNARTLKDAKVSIRLIIEYWVGKDTLRGRLQ